ncbi:hypothetical protein [Phenylobacterium sp.]|jgi:hypothetical protein|uniref:hypothetical protein n=1 Tax=Phenylobacterium sp. TaxID=1871053 RepID=UPI0037840DEB
MATARVRRTTVIIVASAILHAGVMTALVLHAPVLRPAVQEMDGAPPHPVIPILLAPRAAPRGPDGRPGEIRLHRRQVRPRDLPAHVRPLISDGIIAAPAPREIAAPAPAPGPTRPPEPAVDIGRVLRSSNLGCADRSRLTREQREDCDERLGAGARDAPYLGPALDPDKAAIFDASAARKAESVRYRNAPPTSPAAPGARPSIGTAEDMARDLGNDRPALRTPF